MRRFLPSPPNPLSRDAGEGDARRTRSAPLSHAVGEGLGVRADKRIPLRSARFRLIQPLVGMSFFCTDRNVRATRQFFLHGQGCPCHRGWLGRLAPAYSMAGTILSQRGCLHGQGCPCHRAWLGRPRPSVLRSRAIPMPCASVLGHGQGRPCHRGWLGRPRPSALCGWDTPVPTRLFARTRMSVPRRVAGAPRLSHD